MPSIKLDDLFRRYATNAQHFRPLSTSRAFAATARELTGTPDTYVDHTGATRNIASDDYGSQSYMLGDVYASEHAVKNWGPNALPDLVRLADARVLGGSQMSRLISAQPLTPTLATKVITAAAQTQDPKLANQVFGALLNNDSLPANHRLAIIDWMLRQAESRDIFDPVTGTIVAPRVSSPPTAAALIPRLEASSFAGMRGYAVEVAKVSAVPRALFERTVRIAMADPDPSVRRRAAPHLYAVSPPGREALTDLIDAAFSKEAKARLRARTEAAVGPLPAVPDLIGDVTPHGDFYPQRMQTAAEFQAEFLGTMLNTAPKGADLAWLVDRAVHMAYQNPGLTLDILAALERTGATPAMLAATIVKLNDFSDDGYAILLNASLALVAKDPALADVLKPYLAPELTNLPVGQRRAWLAQSDVGLAALLRAGQVDVATVLPRVAAQHVDSSLVAALLEKGAPPEVLLEGVVSKLSDTTRRADYLAALELMKRANVTPAQLDRFAGKLMAARTLVYVNDLDTRGVPGPPKQGDPINPPFPVPQGTLTQALLHTWLASKPDAARAEAFVSTLLAAVPADQKAWFVRELADAGVTSPSLERERKAEWSRVKSNPSAHANSIGDFITPASGKVSVGDLEKAFVAAARAEFAGFKLAAGPALDVDAALAASRAAPEDQRLGVLWKTLTSTAAPEVQALEPTSLWPLANRLPALQRQKVIGELVTLEIARLERVPTYSRFRQMYAHSLVVAFLDSRLNPTPLSAAQVIDLATRVPELKPSVATWLASDAAKAVRTAVLAAVPDLASPPPGPVVSAGRRARLPTLESLADATATSAQLLERLAHLEDVNTRLAASPNSNDLVFEQSDAARDYVPNIFRLTESKNLSALTDAQIAPIAKSLGTEEPLFRLALALNRGEGYEQLASKYRGVGGFDWDGADKALGARGAEAAMGVLLLSGDGQTNALADETTRAITFAAAGRAKAPKDLRERLLLDGLSADPLQALKGVALWDGPSLDWALPALEEVFAGPQVESSSYLGEVQRILPLLLADPRISSEKAIDLLVGATSAFIRGDGWRELSGDELLNPVALATAVLQRPGLTAAQRTVVLNSVIYAGHGEDLKGVFTEQEQRAFDAHVLGRAWTSNRRTVMNDFGSLLGVASMFAAAPSP